MNPAMPHDLASQVAQLIMPRIGSHLPPVRTVEEDADRVCQLLEQMPIGGLCLFNGRWPETQDTLRRLQAVAPYPLLIASDLEQGAGQQIDGMTLFPHVAAFDAVGAEEKTLLQDVATITAQEARMAGIHVTFGPVADVQSDPRNPIIGIRAFGCNTRDVAHRISIYLQTAQQLGLACTAKHFPGHGNTIEDSHATLPTVAADQATLLARDVPPFQAAVQAGVGLVMSAHVAYPALDPSGSPATLSKPILTGLLRENLNFQGVIVSDSLLMDGVRKHFVDETALAIAALRAGVDILLDVEDPLKTWHGISKAAEVDSHLAVRIRESCHRVGRLKQTLGLDANISISSMATQTNGDFAIRSVEHQRVARRLANAACRRWPAWQPVSPPWDACQKIALLVISSQDIPSFGTRFLNAPCPLEDALLHGNVPVTRYDLSPRHAEDNELERQLGSYDHLIAAMLVKPAAWQPLGLPAPVQRIVIRILRQRIDRPCSTTLVSLGSPWVLDEYPQVARRMCTYSDVPWSQRAAAENLLSAL